MAQLLATNQDYNTIIISFYQDREMPLIIDEGLVHRFAITPGFNDIESNS